MPKPLKAITLHRPWPYAIARLGKRIENRNWECPLQPGDYIAIHAGKKFDEAGAAWIRQKIGVGCPPDGDKHPTGIVVICQFRGNIYESDDPWFTGKIGWGLTSAISIDPVPCSGQQGLWNVPEALLETIRQRWNAHRNNPQELDPIAWWRANEGQIRARLPIRAGELTYLRRWPDKLNSWIQLWEDGHLAPGLAEIYVLTPINRIRDYLSGAGVDTV